MAIRPESYRMRTNVARELDPRSTQGSFCRFCYTGYSLFLFHAWILSNYSFLQNSPRFLKKSCRVRESEGMLIDIRHHQMKNESWCPYVHDSKSLEQHHQAIAVPESSTGYGTAQPSWCQNRQ